MKVQSASAALCDAAPFGKCYETTGLIRRVANPFEYDELAVLATATRTAFPLGDLPVLVITRGLQDEEGPQAERLEGDHQHHRRIRLPHAQSLQPQGRHSVDTRTP